MIRETVLRPVSGWLALAFVTAARAGAPLLAVAAALAFALGAFLFAGLLVVNAGTLYT